MSGAPCGCWAWSASARSSWSRDRHDRAARPRRARRPPLRLHRGPRGGDDTSTLPASLLAIAEATHPFLRRDGRRLPNPGYVDPVRLLEPATHDLDPARKGRRRSCSRTSGGRPRRRLRELLAGHRAAPAAVDDLVQASAELVTNALRHGLPPVALRAWAGAGRVVCTVTDRGAGFTDPFAGYQPGGSEDLLEGRFGLWLVRRLCDDMVATHGDDGFSAGIALDVR